MVTQAQGDLPGRIAELIARDEQVRAAQPDPEVSAAVDAAGPRTAQVVAAIMEGYGDRPALGERAVEFLADESGWRRTHLLPHFDMRFPR